LTGLLERDAQHIGAADDPGQVTIGVHDRQPLDVAVLHQLGRLGHIGAGGDRHGRAGHQLGGSHRGGLG
jgi:hypothetical protein